jgi:hypothetical protein
MNVRALICCGLLAAGPVRAADSLLLTGAESSNIGDYAYVGVLMPLGNGDLGNGWVMRHWLDRVTYHYASGARTVDAQSYGYAPAIGYQTPLGRSHIGIAGALRVGNTHLSPDDPSNADHGTRARFSIQAEMTTPFGKSVESQLIAQGQFGNGGYYARERLLIRGFGHYIAGPELVVKGSHEYSAWQAGLTFGGISLGRATILLRGGASGQSSHITEPYGGAEIAVNLAGRRQRAPSR